MKKNKLKALKFSLKDKCFVEGIIPPSEPELKKEFLLNNKEPHIVLLATHLKGLAKPKKEVVVAKLLTNKEKAEITARKKKELRELSLLPPAPYEIISPAPGMSRLNAAELCQMVAPLLISVNAIPAFSACSPTVAFCQGIYDALFPLSNIGRKISGSDKSTRNTLTKQLRNNFLSLLKSCALLANGDLALYLLIGSPSKKKGAKSDKQLPACVFKLNLKKGRGNVGVSCTEIPHAKGYTIWWGAGDFDPSTWNNQSGGATQIIPNLKPGEYLNFVMIAYKGDGSIGGQANIQGCNVPFA